MCVNKTKEGLGAMNRRQALGLLTAAGISTTMQGADDAVPLRTLGKTGEKVSAIGLGGAHIEIGRAHV